MKSLFYNIVFLAMISLLLFNAPAFAETAYIDDKTKIWSRTGPSNAFKVKYKLAPGTKFDILQKDEASGFVQIRDESGRVSWLNPQYLSKTPTAGLLLSGAQSKIQKLQEEHALKVQSLERQLNELQPLQGTNQNLQGDLAKLNATYEQLSQENQIHRGRFKREVFFSGAVVFVAGMLLGWILSKLGGRKRNDSWS